MMGMAFPLPETENGQPKFGWPFFIVTGCPEYNPGQLIEEEAKRTLARACFVGPVLLRPGKKPRPDNDVRGNATR